MFCGHIYGFLISFENPEAKRFIPFDLHHQNTDIKGIFFCKSAFACFFTFYMFTRFGRIKRCNNYIFVQRFFDTTILRVPFLDFSRIQYHNFFPIPQKKNMKTKLYNMKKITDFPI